MLLFGKEVDTQSEVVSAKTVIYFGNVATVNDSQNNTITLHYTLERSTNPKNNFNRKPEW